MISAMATLVATMMAHHVTSCSAHTLQNSEHQQIGEPLSLPYHTTDGQANNSIATSALTQTHFKSLAHLTKELHGVP
jgi:hypothetical protein